MKRLRKLADEELETVSEAIAAELQRRMRERRVGSGDVSEATMSSCGEHTARPALAARLAGVRRLRNFRRAA